MALPMAPVCGPCCPNWLTLSLPVWEDGRTMTITTTLRPNADVNRVNAVTFPSPDNAAMYPVLSDNGDGSYVMLYVIDGAGFMVELATTAVPSSQRIARVRMRVRWKCGGNGYANFAYGLVDSANNALAGDSVSVIKQLAP